MIVDLAVYTNGVRREGPLDLQEALETASEPDSFVWVGLFQPSMEEFAAVRAEFDLHPLAVEDAVNAHQRPKLEQYGDSLFVVLKTAQYLDASEEVTFAELHLFIGDRFVVTVRHGEATALADVRRSLESRPEFLTHGPSAVLHAVVDAVVDGYEPVISGIDNDLREVEVEVFTHERTNPAERIFKLKREVLDFHRNAEPFLEALLVLQTAGVCHVEPALANHFRDVHDHLIRVVTRVDSTGALLSDALNANLAQISVRQNDDMRTISAWVAIAAIPTMFGGVYGMNFDTMPELRHPAGYPLVMTAMAVCCFLVWRRFRKAGWL